MLFGSNLRRIREIEGLSQQLFADKLGIKRTTLSGYEAGTSYPDFLTLVSIVKILDINLHQLVFDDLSSGMTIVLLNGTQGSNTKGNNVISSNTATHRLPTISQPVVVTVDSQGRDNIVFVDQKAAAGYPVNIINPVFYRQLPTFRLPGARYNTGTFRCFEVAGDSMNGSFKSGEWIISRLLDNWTTEVKDASVCVIVTKDSVLVKRVFNRISERSQLILKSDNTAYETVAVPAEEIQEVWTGVAKLTYDLSNANFEIMQIITKLEMDMFDLQSELKDIKNKKGK